MTHRHHVLILGGGAQVGRSPRRKAQTISPIVTDDVIPQVNDIITVGEFYEKAAGGQIIFT
jgi:hypothetical protein